MLINDQIWEHIGLFLAGVVLVVGLVLLVLDYWSRRKAYNTARRRQGDEILQKRIKYAAQRTAAGHKIKIPRPVTIQSSSEDRARWLLHRLLTKKQWQQFGKYGWFHAGWYKGWPIFIGDGCVTWGVRRYCIYPNVAAPRDDMLIAQLLHARTNPRKLIRTGNRIN